MAYRVTHADKTNSSAPSGATTEAQASDYNSYKDKSNNPGILTAQTVSIRADDEYIVKRNTQSGSRNYVKDASVVNNEGIGNGYLETFTSDGSDVNFSTDFDVIQDSPEAGQRFLLILVWDGERFIGSLKNMAGTVTAWTPADLTELLMWFDATTIGSDGSVVDGSNNITTWADKSGNGYDLDGTGHAPLWNTTDAITFDSANSEYLDGSSHITALTALSEGDIFMVCNIGDAAKRWLNVGDKDASSRFLSLLTEASTGGNANNRQIDVLTGTVGGNIRKLDSNRDDAKILLHWSSNNSRYKLYINGVDQDPLTVAGGANDGTWFDQLITPDTFRILCLFNNSSEAFYDGILHEVIITDSEITPADRIRVQDYLTIKHSL